MYNEEEDKDLNEEDLLEALDGDDALDEDLLSIDDVIAEEDGEDGEDEDESY